MRTILLALCFGFVCTVSAEQPDPDQTGILKDRLVRYLKLAKDFDNQRSYVIATVEVLSVTPGSDPKPTSRIYGAANEPATKNWLDVQSIEVDMGGYDGELWSMRFSSSKGIFVRGGIPQWGREYKTVEVDDRGFEKGDSSEHRSPRFAGRFRPVHSAYINPWDLFDSEDHTERIEGSLDYGDHLDFAKYNDQGDIIARFQSDTSTAGTSTVWERAFAKSAQFMPSELKLYYVVKGVRNLVAHSKTEWDMTTGRLLPKTIAAVTFNGAIETHYSVAISYVIGQSCPTEPILDFELSDWREPVRMLFDVDWEGSEFRHKLIFGDDQ